MPEKTQSAASHAKYYPMYHFVASPIALLNLYVAVRHAFHVGGRFAWWNVVLAVGIVATVWTSRVMVLTVQDRLIRLEMRLRLRELSVPAADIAKITVRQFVALRFASDAELPALVARVAKGELVASKDIKAAIKDWQADWQRA